MVITKVYINLTMVSTYLFHYLLCTKAHTTYYPVVQNIIITNSVYSL